MIIYTLKNDAYAKDLGNYVSSLVKKSKA
jgi:hypothetical protein